MQSQLQHDGRELETVGTVDELAMALGGLAVVLGVVVWPPLVAIGLAIWALYALYELVAGPRIESVEPTAGSPTR